MKKVYILILSVVMLAFASSASALTYSFGEEVSLTKNERVVGDYYTAGGSVTVSGMLAEDLFAAGGDVRVDGDVSEDVFIGGGQVSLDSDVEGDVYVAGGNVTIDGTVLGDVTVFGGSVRILSDTLIGGDLIVFGGQVVIDGTVLSDITAFSELLSIGGVVAGDVSAYVEEVRLREGASVEGAFNYRAKERLVIPDSAVIVGDVTFDAYTEKRHDAFGLLAFAVGKLVSVLVAALVLVLVFRQFTLSAVTHSVRETGKHGLIGFAVLVGFPFAVLLLFATGIGAFLGILGLFVYLLLAVLGFIFGGIVFGALLSKMFQKQMTIDWKWTVIGVSALEFITLIPVVGWIFGFVFFLIAFGGLAVFLSGMVLSKKS